MDKENSNKDNWKIWFGSFFLTAISFRILILLTLPQLSETNYEEGGVGLMARHVLQGEHIVFWWGQPYLGTLGVYLTGFLFKFLPNTTFVLRLIPLLFSMLALYFSVLFSKKIFGKLGGIITLCWWAIPPAFLTRLGLTVWNYINCVAFGNIILYLTWRALFNKNSKNWHWYIIGFFWGLSFWDHLISVCYVAVSGLFLFLYILRKRIPLSSLFVSIGGFFTGSFPFWAWNTFNRFETLTAMLGNKSSSGSQIFKRVAFVFKGMLVDISGKAQSFWMDKGVDSILTWLILIFYTAIVVFTFIKLFKFTVKSFGNGHEDKNGKMLGISITFVLFIFASAQVIFSKYNKSIYLMPIYTATPILVTFFIKSLGQKKKWLTFILISFVVGVHGFDNYKLFQHDAKREKRLVDPVIHFLKSKNISHAYAHYRISWQLTFESQEEIISSDIFGFINNKYYLPKETGIFMKPYFDFHRQVDLSSNIAVITHEKLKIPTAGEMENLLNLIGAHYKKERIGQYTVFYNFSRPFSALGEISPERIELKSSFSQNKIKASIDRNIVTEWNCPLPQENEIYIEASFKEPVNLSKIFLSPGTNFRNSPRKFRVDIYDGNKWKQVKEANRLVCGVNWMGNHPVFNYEGKLGICFPPQKATKVKITLTDTTLKVHWTINEIYFYEDKSSSPATKNYDELVDIVRKNNIKEVYSNNRLNALFTKELSPEIKTVTLMEKRTLPLQQNERLVKFDKKTAFFTESSSSELSNTLTNLSMKYNTHEFSTGTLFITEPVSPKAPYYWDNENLLKIIHKEKALEFYLDGKNHFNNKSFKIAEINFIESIRAYPEMYSSYKGLLNSYKNLESEKEFKDLKIKIEKDFSPQNKTHVFFEGSIEFRGFTIKPSNISPGDDFLITYYWVCHKPTSNRNIFVHFIGEDNGEILFQDDHFPKNGKYPTNLWVEGEMVKETRIIRVPKNIPERKIEIHLGLWDPFVTKKRMGVTKTDLPKENNRVHIGNLELKV